MRSIHPVASLLIAALLAATPVPAAEAPAAGTAAGQVPGLEVAGLRVNVVDVDAAVDFGTRVLGFTLAERPSPDRAVLVNGPARMTLHKVGHKAGPRTDGAASNNLNMRVGQLATLREDLRKNGTVFLDEAPARIAIGISSTVQDGSGNLYHLIQLDGDPPPQPRPTVFNMGFQVPDMAKARQFYCDVLGFQIFSEQFYPPTIPLQKRGAIPLTLHERAKKERPADLDTAQIIVQLAASDPAAAARALKAKGVVFLETPAGSPAAFSDPFGNVFELVEAKREAATR